MTLTPRERQVLLLLAGGAGNASIAYRLGVVERTTKKHVTSILEKLRVSSRLGAALVAHQHHRELCGQAAGAVPVPGGTPAPRSTTSK
ncbi:LuxR C-terminal-related transcriptional regulator [Streptomyces sp. NBC_01298]|uniref:response regulator transcription factor n=1 Tax=Streptomyces sp. NBC_01298 TaxID=2903817 RepID=UPI002E146B02|nr:LuxR C-terminal-related transcriptional regulator [Streptomyces sp. NBC_01298]